ncbi:hypothetical protein PVK06_017912 [Gossypium arboreum]|uniref:RNase H type-1 domain-containing protein n=1 Tax=Gossypium arboreum TaxID=29729 RepID=A0ABR0Q485_GOSAR|nr:hypothetical protein PVK06_017912 [Gossypium arboreum]
MASKTADHLRLGCCILNTNGAFSATIQVASTNGLVRDERGAWIRGFVLKIRCTNSLQVELWGVREGLCLARELGVTQLIIELDALLIVQMLSRSFDASHPMGTFVADCSALMSEGWVVGVHHILLEGNCYANHFVVMARVKAEAFARLEDPLNIVRQHTVHTLDSSFKADSWDEGIDCCKREGVMCDNKDGNVVGLDLSCSGLNGSLQSNSDLFSLQNLRCLNLAGNDFDNYEIPYEFSKFKSFNVSQSLCHGTHWFCAT